MAVDLALNTSVGDLIVAPNKDIDVVTGQASVDQRIRVRLMVRAGSWELDPTEGQLGSHLTDLARLPMNVAEQQIPMVVQEALSPMTDIHVADVQTEPDEDDSSGIRVTILYRLVDDEGEEIDEVLATELTIAG